MKRILYVAIGVVVDFPDDAVYVDVPVSNGPLEELAARLQDEACHGRHYCPQRSTLPDVTVWMAAAYRECPNRN
jgi:hypothetical protein